MPLQYQQIQLSFASGLSLKTDKFQIQAGKLSVLENGRFSKAGAICQRNGFSSLPRTTTDGTAPVGAVALATLGSDLVLADGESLYSYSPAISQWARRGALSGALPTTYNITRNQYTQSNQDVAFVGGCEVYVYEDSRGGIRYTIVDGVARSSITYDAVVSSVGSSPKVVASAESATVFWIDGTTIRAATISPVSAAIYNRVVLPLVVVEPVYDVASVDGGSVALAYASPSGVGVAVVGADLSIERSTVVDALVPSKCIGVALGGDARLWVAASDGASSIIGATDPLTLAPLAASVSLLPDAVIASSLPAADRCAAWPLESGIGYAFETGGAITLGTSYVVASPIIRGLRLVGKPFERNARSYLPCATGSVCLLYTSDAADE